METLRPSLSLVQEGQILEDVSPRFQTEDTTPSSGELSQPQIAIEPVEADEDEGSLGSLTIGVRVRGKRTLQRVINAVAPVISHLPASAQQHVLDLISDVAVYALPKAYRLGTDGEWVSMKMPMPTEKVAVLEQVVEQLHDQIEPCWGRVPERLCWLAAQEKAKPARRQSKMQRQTIRILQERYHAGERTQELYDAVLSL